MSNKHTAEISKPADDQRILRGEFTYENGKLDFKCHTQNVEFEEVLQAITAVRDECQRQIDNKEQCPFHRDSHVDKIPMDDNGKKALYLFNQRLYELGYGVQTKRISNVRYYFIEIWEQATMIKEVMNFENTHTCLEYRNRWGGISTDLVAMGELRLIGDFLPVLRKWELTEEAIMDLAGELKMRIDEIRILAPLENLPWLQKKKTDGE